VFLVKTSAAYFQVILMGFEIRMCSKINHSVLHISTNSVGPILLVGFLAVGGDDLLLAQGKNKIASLRFLDLAVGSRKWGPIGLFQENQCRKDRKDGRAEVNKKSNH